MAVFLFAAGLVSTAWSAGKTGLVEERGILGSSFNSSAALVNVAQGAEVVDSAELIQNSNGIMANGASGGDQGAPSEDNFSSVGQIEDPGQPIGPAFDSLGTVVYTVAKGDSLSSIAKYFGISATTISSANPGVTSKSLKVGEKLEILPTSGVVYQSQVGDTLASIATQFNVPQDKILQFNQSVNFSSLDVGASIIIPGGTNNNLVAAQKSTLPNFNANFIMPAQGYDSGILDNDNAVDIANSCGTPVIASADGLVVPDSSIPQVQDGWNDGYGNFILIEHSFGNGIRTRYAQLEKILVQPGQYVSQGQEIGLMGESGDATGCAVHFEVIGAQNPFAK